MYTISPSQMIVELPRNLNREDLASQGPHFSRPTSEPTLMSYYLQRIKLGVTCREVSDCLWNSPDPAQIDYSLIIALDGKFETQMQELPSFLRVDRPSTHLSADFSSVRRDQMYTQAIMINLMLNTRRCKLHLPFLTRIKSNPRFSYSRQTGLQSARAVLDLRRRVAEDASSFSASHFKLGGLLLHVFYATIVLVMDACLNRDDAHESQLQAIRDTIAAMEETALSVPQARRYYESLEQVLRKHHVKLPHAKPSKENGVVSIGAKNDIRSLSSVSDLPQVTSASRNDDPREPQIQHGGAASTESFFDEAMWHDFLNQGPLLDAQDWDALLNDLDMRIL